MLKGSSSQERSEVQQLTWFGRTVVVAMLVAIRLIASAI